VRQPGRPLRAPVASSPRPYQGPRGIDWAVGRSPNETERAARARAERDPATRDRITWAHELVAREHGVSASALRAHARTSPADAHALGLAAGLTRGELLAAGIGQRR
jgi:hypothetical protein